MDAPWTRCARSGSRPESCRVPTVRRSSPVAKHRPWLRPPSVPAKTCSAWNFSKAKPRNASCCTTTSSPSRSAKSRSCAERAVAGVAMGLVKEGDEYAILTDIAGAEDHYGDMDFKVAGTKNGITALQMDIKVMGITPQIMREAMAQAHKGRMHILGLMNEAISTPSKE